MFKCPHCSSSFSQQYTLNRHIKSSKRCIKNRPAADQAAVGNFTCVCGYSALRNDILNEHKAGCNVIKNNVLTRDELLVMITDRDRINREQTQTIAKLEEQVDKLISRPININNSNNTINKYNMSFYKQYVVDNFEAITSPLLEGVMSHLVLENICHGGMGFAKFVKKHIDYQHLLILDQTRKKGMYKDSTGQVKVDGKLRDLLATICRVAYPYGSKLFKKWTADTPDALLCEEKMKLFSDMFSLVGWMSRVGKGETGENDNTDMGILTHFLDEFVAGYTKEALQGHLERGEGPPLLDIHEEVSTVEEVYSEEVEDEEVEYETEVETASVTSSQFDVILGVKNYELGRSRGKRDDDNLYMAYKEQADKVRWMGNS
jgi:hypothetical protein